MKYLFLILSLVLAFSSCKKSNTTALIPSYTYAEVWDTIGVQYEHKYWFTGSIGNYNLDTIIFHTDSTITEIHSAYYTAPNTFDSIRFKVSGSGIYLSGQGFYVQYLPLVDTLEGFYLHDNMIADTTYLYFDGNNPGGYLGGFMLHNAATVFADFNY